MVFSRLAIIEVCHQGIWISVGSTFWKKAVRNWDSSLQRPVVSHVTKAGFQPNLPGCPCNALTPPPDLSCRTS